MTLLQLLQGSFCQSLPVKQPRARHLSKWLILVLGQKGNYDQVQGICEVSQRVHLKASNLRVKKLIVMCNICSFDIPLSLTPPVDVRIILNHPNIKLRSNSG